MGRSSFVVLVVSTTLFTLFNVLNLKVPSDEDAVSDTEPSSDGFTSDEENCCYVRRKPQYKIAHHLKKHENKEPDIAAAFLFPKNSKERKRMLENPQNRGNYQHREVMESHSGPLKLKKNDHEDQMSP